jgi:hypothetical protein
MNTRTTDKTVAEGIARQLLSRRGVPDFKNDGTEKGAYQLMWKDALLDANAILSAYPLPDEAAIRADEREKCAAATPGKYSREIEMKLMDAADLMAATLDQPDDPRCWDHLLIYCPREAVERRLMTINQRRLK